MPAEQRLAEALAPRGAQDRAGAGWMSVAGGLLWMVNGGGRGHGLRAAGRGHGGAAADSGAWPRC